MKKWIFGLVLLLSATSVEAFSANPPKPGSECPKQGITKISQGKKYTCVKRAKKFSWNKGVPFKRANQVVSLAGSTVPTPSPAPTSDSATSSGQSETISTSSFAPPQTPTSFDDLIENYEGISYAAWLKSREKIRQSTSMAPQLKLKLGPTTSLTYTTPEIPYDNVWRLYSNFKFSPDPILLAFNFEDRDWAITESERLLPGTIYADWMRNLVCATKERCGGGGAFRDQAGRTVVVIGVGSQNLNSRVGTLEAHEFTHVVQLMQMSSTNPWPHKDPWPPTWYWEGQATFTQSISMFTESFEAYLANRKTSVNLQQNSLYTAEYLENYFQINPPNSWYQSYDSWRQYDLGSLFVEVLIALKGPDAPMEIWTYANTGMGFAQAFEKVFNISFKTALPIISKAIQLQIQSGK
jgi:hypothetical protein